MHIHMARTYARTHTHMYKNFVVVKRPVRVPVVFYPLTFSGVSCCYSFAVTLPYSSIVYRLFVLFRLCASLWQDLQRACKFFAFNVTAGSFILFLFMCCLWCTSSAGAILPYFKHSSQSPPTLFKYVSLQFFHALLL